MVPSMDEDDYTPDLIARLVEAFRICEEYSNYASRHPPLTVSKFFWNRREEYKNDSKPWGHDLISLNSRPYIVGVVVFDQASGLLSLAWTR